MPSAASKVGPLALPLAPGQQDTALVEPVIDGLLDYLGFFLQSDLNTKLANLRGTSADAAPAANRFPWNPLDPGEMFVRGREDGSIATPALYLWWDGRSKHVPWSRLFTMRERTFSALWVFDELELPGALEDRYGLAGAVDAVFSRACDWGYHPNYGYRGADPGTPIAVSLQLAGNGIVYGGSSPRMMGAIPSGSGADQPVTHAYLTVRAWFTVHEGVNPLSPVAPDDVAPDVQTGISTNEQGDFANPLPILSRTFASPDGAADPQNPEPGAGEP